MKTAHTFASDFPDNPAVNVFSDNRYLTMSDSLNAHVIVFSPEPANENSEIGNLRRAHKTTLRAANHLRELGLPPIIGSFDFEILRLQGLVE